MDDLPAEFAPFLADLADAPEHVRAMWRYAIALLLIDSEKAQAVEMRTEDGRTILRVRTIAGDEFEVERPAMAEELERVLLEQVREIVEENNTDDEIQPP